MRSGEARDRRPGRTTAVCVRSSRSSSRRDPGLAGVLSGGSRSRYPRRAGWGSDADPAVAAAAWLLALGAFGPRFASRVPSAHLSSDPRENERAERQRPHITVGPREDRRYGGRDADLRGEPGFNGGEWELIAAAPARSRTTACWLRAEDLFSGGSASLSAG